MKKIMKILFNFAFLLLFFGLMSENALADNPKTASLKSGKTYTKYDITGDRKADTIRVVKEKGEYDYYDGFRVLINGKQAFAVEDCFYYDASIKLYTLQNKKVFVYIYLESDNNDGPVCGLFKYSNGKLKKVIDFQTFYKYGSHEYGKIVKVSGNTLQVKLYIMSCAVGPLDLKFTFKYKNGTMVPVSRISDVKIGALEYQGITYCTARKSIQLYTGATSNKKSVKVKKGQKIKFINCYVKNSNIRFKVKLENGTTGWLKSPQKFSSDGRPMVEECYYAG